MKPHTWEEWSKAFNVPPVTPKKKKQNRAQKNGRGRISYLCLAEALSYIKPDEYWIWIKVLMGLKYELGEERGGALGAEWSAGCEDKFSEEANAAKLESFQREDGEMVTGDTILFMARENGWDQASYEFRDIFDHARKESEEKQEAPGEQPKPREKLVEYVSEMTLDDQLKRQEGALIKGLLHPGETCTLYGETMAKKTFLLIDLSFHVALGLDWHGRRVKKAPVLFAVYEDMAGFKLRCLAAAKKFGVQPDNIGHILQVLPLNKTDEGKAGAKRIIDAAKEMEARLGERVGLIGIDTRIKALAGDEENSNSDAAVYHAQRIAPIIAATGAAVLSVAHPNKQGDLRGAGYLKQGDDVVLQADGKVLHAEKVKNGITGPIFGYEFELQVMGVDADGDPLTSGTIIKSDLARSTGEAKGDPPKREGKWAGALRNIFSQLAGSGKASFDGATGEKRVDLEELRTSFIKRAEEELCKRSARGAWRDLLKKLPQGYVVRQDATGSSYMVFAP